MRILVTGGDGFVGRHLCAELVERGHDVTSLSRTPDRSVLPAEVTAVSGDVTECSTIEDAFEGRDAVVNLVALSPLHQPERGRSHSGVHIGGSLNTVKAAEEHGVGKVLHMSAYGADPNAAAAYFRAKGLAEKVMFESDLDWVIFRPSVMFGEAGHFVPFARTVTTPYATVLPDGGATRFQPIWIEDSVPLFANAIEDDACLGRVYEIGGPRILTLAEVTKRIYRAQGRATTVESVPMALAEIGLSAVDPIPLIPFGTDQAHALRMDNVPDHNDIEAFGVDESDLTTLRMFLRREQRHSRGAPLRASY